MILKACAYDPEERYNSAAEMKEALLELTRKRAELMAENVSSDTGKKKKGRKTWLAAVCAALRICVGIAVYFATRPASPQPEKNEPTVQSEAPLDDQTSVLRTAAEPEKHMYHVTLTPKKEMTWDAFFAAEKILRGRVDLFADGNEYGWEANDGIIDLYLPADAFSMEKIETAMDCYITRAIKLYLMDSKNPVHLAFVAQFRIRILDHAGKPE